MKKHFEKILRTLKRFRYDQAGAIAVMFALLLPIIISFTGLGVEVGTWYFQRRKIQTMSDAAAIAASYELKFQKTYTQMKTHGVEEATRNGLNPPIDAISVNVPPTTGPYTADPTAIEVTVTRPIKTLFSKMFMDEYVNVVTRSVTVLQESSQACVLALDPTASGAISNIGTTNIELNGCSIAVNSDNDNALSVAGATYLSTECASIVGDYSMGGISSMDVACGEPETGVRPVADPFADLDVPPPAPCDHNNFSATGGVIQPGTYCGGINFSGNVTLAPGTYVIDRGSFNVNAGAVLNSGYGGVTIILTSSTGSQYANVSINGGSRVDFEAPSTGPYAGLVFFQDRDAPTNGTNKFNGGTDLHLTGALYFPKQDVLYTGGAAMGTGDCTQVVGRTVTFNGNANLHNDCPLAKIRPISVLNRVGLVE